MRIVTWNINGIRSICNNKLSAIFPPEASIPPSQHTFVNDGSALSSSALTKTSNLLEQIFQSFNADIICFQETKLHRSKVTQSLALFDHFESYFSFCRLNIGIGGYSGVVTYTKNGIVAPCKAQDGFSGSLSQNEKSDGNTGLIVTASEFLLKLSEDEVDLENPVHLLDSEGRCAMTDHGFFVLLNLYCPNEAEGRLQFKLDFFHSIETVVECLINKGREIVLVGDLNVQPDVLDHCDPDEPEQFYSHPARKWFNNFLAPNGPMVDTFRHFHPNRQSAFTCWNTKIDARRGNYGTRLDYILITKNLIPWIADCDILPNVYGSDHCPVYVDFKSSIPSPNLHISDDPSISLQSKLSGYVQPEGEKRVTPWVCAENFDEFARQAKLWSYFSSGKRKREHEAYNDEGVGTENSVSNVDENDFSIEICYEEEVSDDQTDDHSPASSSVVSSSSQENFSNATLHPFTTSTSVETLPDHSLGHSSTSNVFKTVNKSKQASIVSFFSSKHSTAAASSQSPVTSRGACLIENRAIVAQQSKYISGSSNPTGATKTAAAWSQIFTTNVPKCYHGEPAQSFIVNKKGKNQGRKFWLCARPVGATTQLNSLNDPNYRKSSETKNSNLSRKKAKVLNEFRCDYFEWDKQRRSGGGSGDRKKSAA